MKRIRIIITLLVFPALVLAQDAPLWQWATGGGDAGEGRGMGIATDGAGNVYITGFFSNSLTVGTVTIVSNGGRDVFIAKFNASGDLLWVKGAGGPGHDKGSGIAVNAAGEVLIAGEYRNTAMFGIEGISSAGEEDIFIAKYSSTGDVIWVKSAGGNSPDHISVGNGNGIAVDGDDNIYITGYYGNITGSTANFENITLTSIGVSDIFLSKYDKNGQVVWAKSAGGMFSDYGVGVAVDNSGYIYISGTFADPWAYFGSIKIFSQGYRDVYIAKYNSVGDVVWAKSAGSNLPDGAADIKIGGGHIYVTGSFSGTQMNFESVSLNTKGGFDAFVAQYNTDGKAIWARSAGGPSVDGAHGVAIDDKGAVYITGDFSGKCIFDNELTLTGFGGYDAYVAKYDNKGGLLWAQKAGGAGYDEPNSIALDKGNNIYICGRYTDIATFGKTTIASADSSDIFLAKLNPFPVSIENTIQAGVNIYPNPTTGILYVEGFPVSSTYSIIDLTGSIQQTGKINNKKQQIDIKPLPGGAYYIHIPQANLLYRFVKL